MKRFKKILKYVVGGGVALFVKKLWDPVLDPFVAPAVRWLAPRSAALAMRIFPAVIA